MKKILVVIFCIPILYFGCKKTDDSKNSNPVINKITFSPERASPTDTVIVTVNASDPDGDALSYLFEVSKGTITFNGASAQWILPIESGTYQVEVQVMDGNNGTAFANESLASNSSPVIYKITITPESVVPEETAVVSVNAFDVEGDNITYYFSVDGGIIIPDGNHADWIAPSTLGTYKVTVSVNDGYGGEPNTMEKTLVVTNNHAPYISSVIVTPASVQPNGIATVIVNAGDLDGDVLSYTYIVSAGAIAPNGNMATWTAPSTTGVHSVSVQVSDGNGGTAANSGVLTVAGGGGNTGTVSGTAFFPSGTGGDLSNSKVSLYITIDDWNNNEPFLFGLCQGAGSSVTFSLNNVNPGNYYLDVWKDNDLSTFWSVGDFVGWYGSGGLGSPSLTPFQMSNGGTFNCQVNMYIIAKGNQLKKLTSGN